MCSARTCKVWQGAVWLGCYAGHSWIPGNIWLRVPTVWAPRFGSSVQEHAVVAWPSPRARLEEGKHLALWPWGEEGGPGCPPGLTSGPFSNSRVSIQMLGSQEEIQTKRKMHVLYCWIQELLKMLIICVFECAPAVCMHAQACFWRAGDPELSSES